MKSLLLVSLLSVALLTHAEELKFTTGDWRPYIFESSGSILAQHPGFSVEIVNAVFSEMGYKISYETAPFLRQILETENGKYVALTGVYQEEAPNLIFPQEPIGMTMNCFYVKKQNKWQYDGVGSLEAVKIAVISGYTYGEIDNYINAGNQRLIKLTGGESGMMQRLTTMVDIGRVTAFVQDFAVTEYYLTSRKMEDRYRNAGCLEPIPSMIGFSPINSRSDEFARLFDVHVKNLRKTGELQKILDKYGVNDWK